MKKWSVLLEYGTGHPRQFTVDASNLRTAMYRAASQVTEGGVRQGIPLGRGWLPPKSLAIRITVRRLD